MKARIIIFGLVLVLHLPFIGTTLWQSGRSGVGYWWAAPMVSHLTTVVMVMAILRKTHYFRRFGRRSNWPHQEQPMSNQGMPWLGAVCGLVFLASSVLLVCSVAGWVRHQFGGQCGLCLAILFMPAVPLDSMIRERQRRRVDRDMTAQLSVVPKSGTERSTENLVSL